MKKGRLKGFSDDLFILPLSLFDEFFIHLPDGI